MHASKEAAMEIGDIYLVRLQEAYDLANKEGWQTFYLRVIGEMQIDNEPLHALLSRLGDNRNIFPEFQRDVYYETIALLIAALGQIRSIPLADVVAMGDALSCGDSDDMQLEQMERIARGIHILEKPEYVMLYKDLRHFMSEIVGDDSNTFHAITCVMYLIMALVHPEAEEQVVATTPATMTPAIAALFRDTTGIRW